jgi:isoleucyl-tRNA synthetase
VELMEEVAKRIELEGIEAWFKLDPAELLGAEAADYDKISDTLDVWFDSGTTHWHVLRGSHNDGHASGPRADLYLEGSDQHRGWFHSSLLTGCAIDGHPPYKGLLTHGFAVDGAGRKMSKSLGNVVVPQEVTGKLGAEILRLWVASTDYSGELSISKEILDRVVEVYRRLRNTLRFLLANTADFNPATDMLPVAEWLEIDRYALALTRKLQARPRPTTPLRVPPHRPGPAELRLRRPGRGVPRRAQGPPLHHRRQLPGAPLGPERPVAHPAVGGALMAPILSFTAEEIWQLLGKDADDSVMLHLFHALPAQDGEEGLLARWTAIRAIRADVQKEIEAVRAAGQVGSSLQAEVEIRAAGDNFELLASLGDDLRFVLICSKATARPGRLRRRRGHRRHPSAHKKCERCWHYRDDVGHDAAHPELCGRCTSNLHGAGEARRVA